jgi:hypothetical protein
MIQRGAGLKTDGVWGLKAVHVTAEGHGAAAGLAAAARLAEEDTSDGRSNARASNASNLITFTREHRQAAPLMLWTSDEGSTGQILKGPEESGSDTV